VAWIAGAIAAGLQAKASNDRKEMARTQGFQMSGMDGRTVEAVFDNSGWNINFGGGSIDSTATKSVDQAGAKGPALPTFADPLAAVGQMLPAIPADKTLIYAGVGLVAMIALKRKSK